MTGREIKREGLHRRSSIILACSFLLGNVFGVLFASALDSAALKELSDYLQNYFFLFEAGEISQSALTVLIYHGHWILLCALLVFLPLGVLLIPVLIGIRGFLLGFSLGCFCHLFGGTGMASAAVLFGISALIWVPALCVIAATAMEYSLSRCFMSRGSGQPIPYPGRRLREAFFMSIFMLIVCVCIECWLVPLLLPTAAEIIF